MDWTDVLNSNYTIEDSIKYYGINKILLKIDSSDVKNLEFDDAGHTITKLLINNTATRPFSMLPTWPLPGTPLPEIAKKIKSFVDSQTYDVHKRHF